MANKQQQFGKDSEDLATKHLKKSGYKILQRNYRCELGEIDIVATEKGTIAFVEVKARQTGFFGDAKAGVTPKKQKKISMVALYYLKENGKSDVNARFDVVAIDNRWGEIEVEIIKNAFELSYG